MKKNEMKVIFFVYYCVASVACFFVGRWMKADDLVVFFLLILNFSMIRIEFEIFWKIFQKWEERKKEMTNEKIQN